MDTVELIKPTAELEEDYRRMIREYQSEPGDRESGFHLEAVDGDFTSYIKHLEMNEKGIGLPSGHVPYSTYWLVRNGNQIIGISRLRHRLTPSLEQQGGHIGYYIRPSERGRGYGTRILTLTLEKACEMGIKRVLITCYTDNIRSARVILRNGGVPDGAVSAPRTGRQTSRYWIELEEK